MPYLSCPNCTFTIYNPTGVPAPAACPRCQSEIGTGAPLVLQSTRSALLLQHVQHSLRDLRETERELALLVVDLLASPKHAPARGRRKCALPSAEPAQRARGATWIGRQLR